MTRINKFFVLSLLLLSASGCASTFEKNLSMATEKPMVEAMAVSVVAQFHKTYGRWPKDASELGLNKDNSLPSKGQSLLNSEEILPYISFVESSESKCIINFTSSSGYQGKIALEAPNEHHTQYIGDYLDIHGAPVQTEGTIFADLTVAPVRITFSEARAKVFAEHEKGQINRNSDGEI